MSLLEKCSLHEAGRESRMNSYGNEAFRNRKEREKEERARIREFDKDLFSYTGQIAWFLAGLFSFILLVLMVIPVQEIARGDGAIRVMCIMIPGWISYAVLLPYVNVTDSLTPRQKNSGTYRKLKYLPVSKKQYRRVRMAYLFRFLWKLALIGIVIQCVVAAADLKSVTVWNVLYVIGILLVYPLFLGWLWLFTS